MRTLNFSLPDDLKRWVETQVASGGYGNTSEYLRELIRLDRKRKQEERLETLLIEGLDSGPARDMTPELWERLKDRVLKRAQARGARGKKAR